ncbi:Putative transposase of IS4/5 family [Methylobacterium sp. 13MFTsu3.1M2]|nr:Putative transposase of IS4/5 family [Methylobacterium sp. 13MFTsu3.1M2]
MVEVEAQLDATMEPETYGLSAESLASLRERLESEIRGIASELETLTVQYTESDRGSRAAVDFSAVIATMLGRLPFEARDPNDRELIDTFRSAVDRIEIDLSAKDRSYRIRVSPAAWSGHTKTAGTIERLFDRPRFGFLGDPDRAAAALDAANRELFALADDDWEVVEHLFARRNWRRLEPRRLVDALLFHTWTKVPIICAPPRFGSAVTLNAAMTELVRSGTWANVISLLAEAESPVVAGIDATYFDHWKSEARK